MTVPFLAVPDEKLHRTRETAIVGVNVLWEVRGIRDFPALLRTRINFQTAD